MKIQLIIVSLNILCISHNLPAMESTSRSQSPRSTQSHYKTDRLSPFDELKKFEGHPVDKIYHELASIEEELAYLMNIIQDNPSENHLANLSCKNKANDYPFNISLSCTKKLAWIPRIFCNAQVTLHKSSCSSLEQYSTLTHNLTKFFFLCHGLLDNQIQQTQGFRTITIAYNIYSRLSLSLQETHKTLMELLTQEKTYWRTNQDTPAFKTIETIHSEWAKTSAEKALKNSLGSDLFTSLPNGSIAKYRVICAEEVLHPECYQKPQQRLMERLSGIANTDSGKPKIPDDKSSCVDVLLGKKAFDTKYNQDIRLLILNHVSQQFMTKNRLKIIKTLKKLEQILSPSIARKNTIAALSNKMNSLQNKSNP